MRHYTQLTQEQRYQIYALLKMDHSQVEIAKVISVHKSTISRELRRNRGLRGYRPKQAHRLAVNDPVPRPDFLGDLVKPIHRQTDHHQGPGNECGEDCAKRLVQE